MQAKSIAECFKPSAVLLTFIKLPFVIGVFSLSFLGGCLKTSFAVSNTYMYFLFLWSSALFNCAFYTTKMDGPLGPLPCKVISHILKSWDNDPGPSWV